MALGRNAQGTIEYLIILAIIVVIGLIVITLILQFTDAGKGLRQNDSEIKWRSATPFAITNHAQSSGSLTVILKNNTASTINFTSICVGGSTTDCNSQASMNMAPNATLTKIITGLASCASDTTYSFAKANIFIDYNIDNTVAQTQLGVADLIGTCQ